MNRTCVPCAALAALLVCARTAAAGIEPTPFAESPLMGGSYGQVLRITIVATGPLCEATIGFRDMGGIAIGDDNRIRRVALKQGETAVHDLHFNAHVSRLGQRYEARALVTYPTVAGHSLCRWSAEIFDQFLKRTTLFHAVNPPDPSAPNVPPPDPSAPLGMVFFAPIGAAFSQTVRMSVVADSPQPAPNGGPITLPAPCAAELRLHSAVGAPLAVKTVRLEPGRSDVLDLNVNGLVRLGERTVISPRYMAIGSGSTVGCKFSVQVFDQGTGWTQAFATPF